MANHRKRQVVQLACHQMWEPEFIWLFPTSIGSFWMAIWMFVFCLISRACYFQAQTHVSTCRRRSLQLMCQKMWDAHCFHSFARIVFVSLFTSTYRYCVSRQNKQASATRKAWKKQTWRYRRLILQRCRRFFLLCTPMRSKSTLMRVGG